MKNSTRILWTLALVLLIAGLICTGGAFAFAGFNPENLSTENAQSFGMAYPVSDKILKITVKDSNTPVKITSGGRDDHIYISYTETKHHTYTLNQTSISGGTELIITGREKRDGLSWMDFIGVMEVADRTLTIAVPDDYDILSLISITTSNQSVNVVDINSDCEIYVKTSNSKIFANNLNVSDISLTSSNGSMTLRDITSDKGIIAKTSNSSITADSVISPSVSLTTSNGSIKAYNLTAEQVFSASTSNSSITADIIDSHDITLTTSNGSVSGSVKGERADYVIVSRTSNGNSNLGDDTYNDSSASAPRKLTVKTSNSSISVSFNG